MGNKVRDFLVGNAQRFLIAINLTFLIFGIVTVAQSNGTIMNADEQSPLLADNLNVTALAQFGLFAGIVLIISSLAGFVTVVKTELRKLLVVYMGLLFLLGFAEVVVGGYMNGRDCAEIKDLWFTNTAFYAGVRRDFKKEHQCCGFDAWNDDYFLDQDDIAYRRDPDLPADATPGCYVNINVPGSDVTCQEKCNEAFDELAGGAISATIGFGVIQLLAGGLVTVIILREKRLADPTTSDFYF